MSVKLKWVGREVTERIADVRMKCFGGKPSQRADFLDKTVTDRFADGDVLIAEDAGVAVGSATHLSLSMHIGGTDFPCQGVAWVGTVKSHRRRKSSARGVASSIMFSLVDRARERGDVVSALMPFRASFYEHFGYGVVERMNVWSLPMALLDANSDGFREASVDDHDAMAACRTRQARAGQCDVDTGVAGVQFWAKVDQGVGFTFIDRPDPAGPVNGFVTVGEQFENDQAIAFVEEPAYDSPASLMRLLGFLGSLRDQYSFARLHLPNDLPLNWLLKERQVPHRRIDHPAALCRSITRMQVRILDHLKLLSSISLRTTVKGRCVVSVREAEGGESRFALELDAGRVSASATAESAAIELPDQLWASIVCGAVSARWCARFGLIRADEPVVELLEQFASSPAPFSWEYF